MMNPLNDPFWNMDMPGMDVGLFPGSSMDLGFPRRLGGQLTNWQQPQFGIDLTEEENNWVVHADLPGFKDEDVELSIENGMLGVRAKREKTIESDTGISHRVEVNKT
jgi:HSP20 family molecular chaperone IbpA